jgi:hypothetical protein
MTRAERVYRLLLAAFPREFRDDVGEEMVAVFRARHRDESSRGRRARVRLWARTVWDVAASATAEHVDAWRVRRDRVRTARPSRRRGQAMDTLSQDLCYAARSLLRAPGFTAVAVLTLAIGIGGNAAIFSAVNAVLLRPLPFPGADRLVTVWGRTAAASQSVASWPEFEDWRAQTQSFATLSVWRPQSVNLTGSGEPERVAGAFVSASLFPMLGASPRLGRVFEPAETEPASVRPVVVLSQGLWHRRFGGDSGILGRSLVLNGQPLTVIGVMGPEMEPGRAPFDAYFMGTDAWIPAPYFPNAKALERGETEWLVAGRLRPGVTVAQAHADVEVVARRLEQAYPDTHAGRTVLTGFLFGVLPALQASRPDLGAVLKEGRGSGSGRSRRRFRDALVVWEVALSMVLLIGAGLLLKSALALHRTDPGFRTDRLLTWEFRLPPSKYREPEQIATFFRQALERLRAVPGVESADLVRAIPFSGNAGGERYAVDGREEPPPGKERQAQSNIVSPGYFGTMGIPLVRGRVFDDHDRSDKAPVVVINATMAGQVWPGEDPLGRRLRFKGRDQWATVIGVVGDVKHTGLDQQPVAQVYSTHDQDARIFASLVARTTGDPLLMAEPLRRAFWSVDPDQPVWKVRSMDDLMRASRGSAQAMATLVGVFAGVSVILAAMGPYGVMSYAVSLRRREIGIRMALGARGREVMRLVVGRGLALTAVAVGIGVAGAAALSRLLASLLFGVMPTDALTFAGAAGLMCAVTLLASYLPARRAARLDPLSALAEE